MRARDIARVIRREVRSSLARLPGEVTVALSGGVDSCSLLAGLLSVGMSPFVVSYTPDTHDSTDFSMAYETASRLGLRWEPCVIDMRPEALEATVRQVIALGYKEKVQVECLAPVVHIARTAQHAGARYLVTGDQADGYFALSKWASHNADRAAGIPRGERTNVQADATPERIDHLRQRYWTLDKSCSGGVRRIAQEYGLEAVIPYRNPKILQAFFGSLWSEVNRPRLKEPIRLAFEDELASIPTRKLPVNLHKGDSYFAEKLGETLMAQPHLQGRWRTPRGLYAAMARGEV